MTTLIAGVIVAGVGRNANPHALHTHTDVALSSPTDGDIIRYNASVAQWQKFAPSGLPVPAHTHSGVYVVPSDLTPLAPKANPPLTGTVTITDGTPTVKYVESDAPYTTWDNSIRVDGGGMFFKMDGEDTRKIESRYVDYQALSLGLPALVITEDATASNPGCVRYIDATDGDVVVSLQAIGNYYRTVQRLTGVMLFFVREDSSANTVTIAANGADTIDGAASITLDAERSFAIIQATDAGWKTVASSGAAAADTDWEDMQWYSTKWTDGRTYWGVSGMDKFQARKIGNQVYLRGGMHCNSPITGENVFQLPSNMYPSVPLNISGRSFNGTTLANPVFTLKTDGYVATATSVTIVSGHTVYVDAVSFLTT